MWGREGRWGIARWRSISQRRIRWSIRKIFMPRDIIGLVGGNINTGIAKLA